MGGLRWLLALLILSFHAAPVAAQERWVAAWAASQRVPDDDQRLPADARDVTLRQVVRVQIGGQRVRLRFTNLFGTAPLKISAASVALAPDNAAATVDSATLRRLRFNGKPAAIIPMGADYWSDPVDLRVRAGQDLAVSIHLPDLPERSTSHPGARATSWYVQGDHTASSSLTGARSVNHWYQLAGVEVTSPDGRALVVLGDSITDGFGVAPNSNKRFTDALQARVRADKRLKDVAVLNAGIGGNRLLSEGLGANGLARFDRDVLTPPGVSHLIVMLGANDLGRLTRDGPVTAGEHALLVERITGALQQLAARARSRGIKVIGGTIVPFGGSRYYRPGPLNEADRQAVNAWIRTPGNFDGVIDFDPTMADPARPTHLRADYDKGDGIHPSIAGYAAMATAVELKLLR